MVVSAASPAALADGFSADPAAEANGSSADQAAPSADAHQDPAGEAKILDGLCGAASDEDWVRAGGKLEELAIAERERFCDELGRDDDMPRHKPFRLSGAMRAQLVVDQWADSELLPILQACSRKSDLSEAERAKATLTAEAAEPGRRRVSEDR